ncbi:MAG: fibrillarin-like rRNA/tRNA 2'-O-methyltransferase [Candidatus Methanofastidiosia archaeon]
MVRGQRVYGEKLINYDKEEYRAWNPYRSKLASAIMLGLKDMPIEKNSKVLYLGAATGTTVSHISDVASEGMLYCVEFSPRAMRDFLNVAKTRNNIAPILGDANKPLTYAALVEEVDVIYQDIAQVEQSKILLKNLPFLRVGGHVMLCIKARSIDVTKPPEKIFAKEIKKLKRTIKIKEIIDIKKYEKDHLFVLGIKR